MDIGDALGAVARERDPPRGVEGGCSWEGKAIGWGDEGETCLGVVVFGNGDGVWGGGG
jgi:hypothetical protein